MLKIFYLLKLEPLLTLAFLSHLLKYSHEKHDSFVI